jgi:hypothetical protein
MLPGLPHGRWVHGAGVAAAVQLAGAALGSVLLRVRRRAGSLPAPIAPLVAVHAGRLRRAAPTQSVQGAAGAASGASVASAAFLSTTASWVVLGLSNWLVLLAFHFQISPLAGGAGSDRNRPGDDPPLIARSARRLRGGHGRRTRRLAHRRPSSALLRTCAARHQRSDPLRHRSRGHGPWRRRARRAGSGGLTRRGRSDRTGPPRCGRHPRASR